MYGTWYRLLRVFVRTRLITCLFRTWLCFATAACFLFIRLVSEKGILARGLAHPVVFRSLAASRSSDVGGADRVEEQGEQNARKTPPTVSKSGGRRGRGGEKEGGKDAKGGRGSGDDMLEFFTKASKRESKRRAPTVKAYASATSAVFYF